MPKTTAPKATTGSAASRLQAGAGPISPAGETFMNLQKELQAYNDQKAQAQPSIAEWMQDTGRNSARYLPVKPTPLAQAIKEIERDVMRKELEAAFSGVLPEGTAAKLATPTWRDEQWAQAATEELTREFRAYALRGSRGGTTAVTETPQKQFARELQDAWQAANRLQMGAGPISAAGETGIRFRQAQEAQEKDARPSMAAFAQARTGSARYMPVQPTSLEQTIKEMEREAMRKELEAAFSGVLPEGTAAKLATPTWRDEQRAQEAAEAVVNRMREPIRQQHVTEQARQREAYEREVEQFGGIAGYQAYYSLPKEFQELWDPKLNSPAARQWWNEVKAELSSKMTAALLEMNSLRFSGQGAQYKDADDRYKKASTLYNLLNGIFETQDALLPMWEEEVEFRRRVQMVKENNGDLSIAATSGDLSKNDILELQAYLSLSPAEQQEADEERWAKAEFLSKSGLEQASLLTLASLNLGATNFYSNVEGFVDAWRDDGEESEVIREASAYVTNMNQQSQARQEQYVGYYDNPLVTGYSDTLALLTEQVPTILAAVAASGPVAVIKIVASIFSGILAGGEAYNDVRARGATEPEARAHMTNVGGGSLVIPAVLERAPGMNGAMRTVLGSAGQNIYENLSEQTIYDHDMSWVGEHGVIAPLDMLTDLNSDLFQYLMEQMLKKK
jgi:hypothetical protein